MRKQSESSEKGKKSNFWVRETHCKQYLGTKMSSDTLTEQWAVNVLQLRYITQLRLYHQQNNTKRDRGRLETEEPPKPIRKCLREYKQLTLNVSVVPKNCRPSELERRV